MTKLSRNIENRNIQNDIISAPKGTETRSLIKSLSEKYSVSKQRVSGCLSAVCCRMQEREVVVIVGGHKSILV